MDYIARDSNGQIVGKWRRASEPNIPERFDVQEVEDVAGYEVDEWYNESLQ